MRRWQEEALQAYKEECFKQTRPYQYEMAYEDNFELQGGKSKGNPPTLAYATTISFPDDVNNILNFEGINTEYIVFVSTDGVLEKNAIETLIKDGNGADIIYCDEDFTNDTKADIDDINVRIRTLRTPWRKPGYSHDTLLSFPYIETMFAIRTAFARSVPAIKKSPELGDSVRVWDFLLRATERTNKIVRVPKVLFHRDVRTLFDKLIEPVHVSDEDIYAALYERYNKPGYQLCREATNKRRGLTYFENEIVEDAKASADKKPLVSIIIPSKDHPDMLKDCIRNIRINAGSVPYEVIVVDNGSDEDNSRKAKNLVENIPGDIGMYVYEEFDFDFSRMCNIGATKASGDFLLFLNDDVDAITEGFLQKLIRYAAMPYVGAVGAKLLYPDNNTIQHIGVTDMNRGPTHKLITLSDDKIHYFGKNRYAWNVLAVTAACLMVAREKYFQVGGFSDKMKVGYNDVDLCVKLYENGYLNVVNNECVLLHKESVSRGSDSDNLIKSLRLRKEREYFYEAHAWLLEMGDPFHNPYLDVDTIEYKSFVVPDYQKTDYRNKTMDAPRLPVKPSESVNFSIDRCGIERAIDKDVPDAYVFDGWALVNKKDNAFIKKYMVFVPLDEDGEPKNSGLIASVSDKLREDVKEVFPDAVNVNLAGFECRIPVTKLQEGTKYQIGVLVKNMGYFGRYKMTLGDIYEPGRGIITDK